MSPQYPNQNPYPGVMPPKKTSPWVWVGVGCGALLIVVVLVIAVFGYFVYYRAKQAGLDPDLMKRNPALAVSKIVAATNPNIEVLGVDDAKGIIRVREKSTGRIMTLNFEDAKRGKFVFQEEGKDAVSVIAGGPGAGKTPDWAPVYPGSTVEGNVSMQGGEGEGGSFHFTTKDSSEKVIAFYESALKSAGLKVTSNSTREGGAVSGGMVMGMDEAKKRNVMVTVGASDGATAVNVVFSTKP